MVMPEKETKMTEIQIFVGISRCCDVGTGKREEN